MSEGSIIEIDYIDDEINESLIGVSENNEKFTRNFGSLRIIELDKFVIGRNRDLSDHSSEEPLHASRSHEIIVKKRSLSIQVNSSSISIKSEGSNPKIHGLLVNSFHSPKINNSNEEEKQELNINEILKDCLICQVSNNFSNTVTLHCGDAYCRPCLTQYTEIRIQESQVLVMPCPKTECHSQLKELEIKNLVTPALFQKYLKFKAAEEISQNPFHKWCPKPDCEGFDIGNTRNTNLKCNKCEFKFCYYCSESWHEKTKCKLIADKNLDKWAKSNGVKYCPNCKRKVQKTIGCDHMTCAKCKYEWCWLCGRNYISGHYGECEAKKLNKKNPPLWKVLVLLFAPIEFPFLLCIIFGVLAYKARLGTFGSLEFRRFAGNHKILAYAWAVALGIILSPFFFSVAPFVCTMILCRELFKKCCYRSSATTCSLFLMGFATPLFVAFAVLGIVFAHVIGVFLLLWKMMIVLIRIIKPGFLLPNYSYGYN